MEKGEADKQVSPEMEQQAARTARERAQAARWNLDIAIFLFAVLIIIIILLFEGIGLGVVAPVAIFGLTMVWLVGWRRGNQLYPHFYDEELLKLRRDLKKADKGAVEETIEERVQRALRERLK